MFELYEDANRPFEICISPKEDISFYEDMLAEGCAMHKVKFPSEKEQSKYQYTYVLIERNGNKYNFTYMNRKQAESLIL